MNLKHSSSRRIYSFISQFTLYADTNRGNRPSFTEALNPVEATHLYDVINETVISYRISWFKKVFGAHRKYH
jgi:D-tyrosyl-tRNA(Tyr) deacylase